MGKKQAFPGSYYDTDRFETWLRRHAAEGLQFYGFSHHGKLTMFHHAAPRQVRYYVEPDFGQYTSEEMEKAYREQGWVFVEELRGTCLIYETEDLWAIKPRGVFQEKDWTKKWRKLLWGQIGSIFLTVLSIYLLLRPFLQLRNAGELQNTILVVVFFLCALTLILQNIWPLGANLYDIYVWNRRIRRNEETEEWKGIMFLRWGEIILYWLMIVSVVIMLVASFFYL